jgi:hypothetical protein
MLSWITFHFIRLHPARRAKLSRPPVVYDFCGETVNTPHDSVIAVLSEISRSSEDLLRISEIVEVASKVTAIRADLADNLFLALAVDGRAEVIVSGNHHLLDIRQSEGIPITRVR